MASITNMDVDVPMMSSIEDGGDLVAAQQKKEFVEVQSAFLGYAKVDYIKMGTKFGQWNKRSVMSREVQKILLSFQSEGIQRFVTRNLVPIVLPKEFVDVKALHTTSGTGGDDFPWLKFIGSTTEVYAAGGQHRLQALIQLQTELEAKINDADEDETDVDQLKRQLKQVGVWGIAVYDLGEWIILLTIKISNN